MSRKTLKGEAFTWHHVTHCTADDRDFLSRTFDMLPYDLDVLARHTSLPHFAQHGSWHLVRLHIPNEIVGDFAEKILFTVLFSKHTVATVVDGRIAPLEKIFFDAKRTGRVPAQLRSGAVGDILALLFDAVFDIHDSAIEEVSRDIQKIETSLDKRGPDVVARDVCRLRREMYALDLMVEPSRSVLQQILDTREPYSSPRVTAALRVLEDRLRAMHVVLEHHGRIVDALLREHEVLLTHRTNRIIQVLTLISVLLMPPTLVASYYGMNVAGLPFAHDIRIVSAIVATVILGFVLVVVRLLRR